MEWSSKEIKKAYIENEINEPESVKESTWNRESLRWRGDSYERKRVNSDEGKMGRASNIPLNKEEMEF